MKKQNEGVFAALWEDFQKKVIPNDAPQIQCREMKRAFYSGGTAMLTISLVVSDEVTQEEGEKILETVSDELREFAKAVGEGKA